MVHKMSPGASKEGGGQKCNQLHVCNLAFFPRKFIFPMAPPKRTTLQHCAGHKRDQSSDGKVSRAPWPDQLSRFALIKSTKFWARLKSLLFIFGPGPETKGNEGGKVCFKCKWLASFFPQYLFFIIVLSAFLVIFLPGHSVLWPPCVCVPIRLYWGSL